MDNDDCIVISGSSDNEEQTPKKQSTIAATKAEIESDKELVSDKVAQLRNRLANLKKRQKGDDGESKEDTSPAKKIKTDTTVHKSDAKIETKIPLPSFKPLAEVSFDSVIKVVQPSLFEPPVTESSEQQSPIAEASEQVSTPISGPQFMADREKNRTNDAMTTPTTPVTPPHTFSIPQSPAKSTPKNKTYKEFVASKKKNEPRPLVKVIFRDEEIARLFRKSVKETLIEVLSLRDPETDDSKVPPNLELNIWEYQIPDEPDDITGGNGLFKVDTTPVKTPLKRQIPKYLQTLTNALDATSNTPETPKEASAGSTINSTCFNCSGNHFLSDCPIPINDANVSKNRQKFMVTRKFQPRTSRYHIDEEQRFAHLKPGNISDNLRNALGLRHNQLPKFVYRMRLFGYPPGWLEEARITHSGIALINEGPDTDNNYQDNGVGQDTYDIRRIIEYPGFNVNPIKGTIDESPQYRCPGMLWEHTKEAMIEQIGSSAATGYKRKKLASNNTSMSDIIQTNDDMEVVELDDEVMIVLDSTADTDMVLEEDSDQHTKTDKSSPESGACSTNSSRARSPDLARLEAVKEKLLQELEGSQPNTPSTPTNSVRTLFLTPDIGRSKSLSMGTPIIDSASPYSTLPSADKFSQGISDHLNFENLPDATGKYERMKGIIKKVRKVVDKIQQDEDACS